MPPDELASIGARLPGRSRAVAGWVSRHPDAVGLGLVLAVAALFRLAFAFRAPPFFVGGDSQTYLSPAFELVSGLGFNPILKRPPLYPLFVAGAIELFGKDLHGLALAQHGVGLATVSLTYLLGRLVANRAVGIVAGLLVAINGPIIVYERYVMAETLATLLLLVAILALVWAVRGGFWQRYAWAGAALGVASLCRSSFELAIPLVPLIALGWGRLGLVKRLAGFGLGFGLVLLPWVTTTWAQSGSLGASGLGEALFWRGTRESPSRGEPSLISREIGRPSDVADQTRQAARRLAYQHALDDDLPSDIAVLLQQRYGYSEADADAIMRDVALELFGRQPGRYFWTSALLFGRLLAGSEQWLGGQGKTGGVERYPNPQEKYSDWWDERIRDLARPASPAEANEFRRAQAIVNLYQPYRFAAFDLSLLTVGTAAAIAIRRWRLALIPLALGLWLLLVTAFLSGALPRYRYPAEPILSLGVALGAVWLVALVRGAIASRAAKQIDDRAGPDADEDDTQRNRREVVALPVQTKVGGGSG